MLNDFFLISGEFSKHFFMFLFLFFGVGLYGGFFSHLNDYYKRDQQYKSINQSKRIVSLDIDQLRCYGIKFIGSSEEDL